ncbi:MAG: hypothetical protein KJ950_04870 [Proteobacteria bacterium]|nr:hypothetical protein [Pseudomonadota bacterium]MBU1686873.1 hypothetical protein [Pseudomonadota bacterium]
MKDSVSSFDISPGMAPTDAERIAVQKTVAAFMAALRNYAVFPPEHPSTLNMISSIHQGLTRHLEQYETLPLRIEKEMILYGDERVFDGADSDENPVLILYRDGIRHLEISKGIDLAELLTFFKIFSHYRVLTEESEDDLVTALWRADLQHIHYQAADELWDEEPVLDFSVLQAVDPEQQEEDEPEDQTEETESDFIRPNDNQNADFTISSVTADHELWRISPDEKKHLDKMIRDCVAKDHSEEIVRLMLLILHIENDPQIFVAILSFLKEEFQLALAKKDFRVANILLQELTSARDKTDPSCLWAVEALELYFAGIAEPLVLHPLQTVWDELTGYGPDEMKNFTTLLQKLPARAGATLAPMLDHIKSENVRVLLIEIIATYALRDHQTFAELISRPEEDLILRLLHLVKTMTDRQEARSLLHIAAQHPSKKVRTEIDRIINQPTATDHAPSALQQKASQENTKGTRKP